MRIARRLAAFLVVAALAATAFAFARGGDAAPTRPHATRPSIGNRLHEVWRLALPYGDVGQPAADQAGVVVTAGKSKVVAISRAGRVAWTADVAGAELYQPRLTDDAVYVATDRGVEALRRDDGSRLWHASTAPGGQTDRANRPVVVGNTVVITAADGLALGLDAATGAETWRTTLPTQVVSEPAAGGGAGAAPVVVVVGVAEWWGLDPATGAIRWSGDLGLIGTSSPVVYASGADTLAAVATDGKVLAVDGSSGEQKWVADADQTELLQVPTIAANGTELLVPDHWGRLASYDPYDGRRLWSVTGADAVAEFGEPVLVAERTVALALDADGPRLATPAGSAAIRLPAGGHAVGELPGVDGGLVVTTWGKGTNYVLLYRFR